MPDQESPLSPPANTPDTGLSRRTVLQAGGIGLAAGLTPAAMATGTAAEPTSGAIEWQAEADVVVCGSGSAGSMAALAAAKQGASVILLEKAAMWGGTSAKAGFHIWIPNNDDMASIGAQDDRDQCLKFMAQHAYPHLFDPDSDTLGLPERQYTLLATYYDNGRRTVRQIADWDVVEFRVARLGRQRIAAVDYNDNSPWNTVPVGRSMGPITPNGRNTYGRYVVEQFRHALRDSGVDIRMRHRALQLHHNAAGAVIGVAVQNDQGDTVNIRARRGVVFGSGCYSANRDYMTQFQMMPVMGSCAAPSNEGDFIAIGGAAGAQMGNLSGAWRAQVVLEDSINYVSAPTAVFWPIGDSMFVVNKYGQRCLNEKRNYNDRTKGLFHYDSNKCELPNLITFMVFDQRCADLYAGSYPIPHHPDAVEYIIKGDTLDALAAAIRKRLARHAAHTGNLELDTHFEKNIGQTFARFNTMAKAGVDTDFQRGEFAYDKAWHAMRDTNTDTDWDEPVNPDNITMHPLQDEGPYYAIVLVPGCIGTNGGPVINERAQVLDYREQAIAGLYGAGNCIASPAANAYWGGGTTIGSALIFGHIAGEQVAAESIKEIG